MEIHWGSQFLVLLQLWDCLTWQFQQCIKIVSISFENHRNLPTFMPVPQLIPSYSWWIHDQILRLGMPRINRHRTWFHVQPSHHDSVEANEALAGKKNSRPANHLDLRVENHGMETKIEPSYSIETYHYITVYKDHWIKWNANADAWAPSKVGGKRSDETLRGGLNAMLGNLYNWTWRGWITDCFYIAACYSPVLSRKDHGMSCGHYLQTSYPSLVGASSSKNLFPHLARNGATTSEALAGKITTNLKIESTSSYGKFENHFMCSAWDVGIYSAKLQGHQTEWDQWWLWAMSTHASGVGFYIFVVIHYRHSGRHMIKFWPTWSAILFPVATVPKESVISDRSSCKTYKPDWLRNDAWHAGPFLEKIIMFFSSLSSHFFIEQNAEELCSLRLESCIYPCWPNWIGSCCLNLTDWEPDLLLIKSHEIIFNWWTTRWCWRTANLVQVLISVVEFEALARCKPSQRPGRKNKKM